MMKHIRPFEFSLVTVAVLIVLASLFVSHVLVRDLLHEERTRVELWAEAMRQLETADETTDLSLVLNVLNANHTIPVIVVDQDNSLQAFRNIRLDAEADSIAALEALARTFRRDGNVLRMELNEAGEHLLVLYGKSVLLTRLGIYPYVQLAVVLLFVSIAIFALLKAKRAEQNKVWVGLSKETAHQLGTPISSLMAWTELLKTQYPADELLPAMTEDVERLQMIANRFSKIGSTPELTPTALRPLLEHVVEYIRRRTSDKVTIRLRCPDTLSPVRLNASLFEWVVENLCKNAVDAMDGVGTLTIGVEETDRLCYIDVEDTGKGIDRRRFHDVFSPGYTTKKRGWGLGLSLARRIVTEYHYGRIYVKQSELNRGTIFRIELKK